MQKLSALMPQMGPKAHRLALAEVDWDVDAALNMLRAFQVACLDRINALTKVRLCLLREALGVPRACGDLWRVAWRAIPTPGSVHARTPAGPSRHLPCPLLPQKRKRIMEQIEQAAEEEEEEAAKAEPSGSGSSDSSSGSDSDGGRKAKRVRQLRPRGFQTTWACAAAACM
jgi:hypothetical protein